MQKQPPPGAYPPGTKLTVGSHAVTIKSYISEGGFAHVYVVKISPPTLEGDIACLKRVVVPDKVHLNLLRAEVDAMKRLKGHPNIVRYIDSHAARLNAQGGLPSSALSQLQAQGHGQGGNQVYEVFLLMEYCSGNGLIDFMNTRLREQLTESEILKITCDVSYGLACMHYLQPPLIHRDLKIENILISADGTYKLCDFGSVSPVLRPPRNPGEFHILEEDIQRHTTAQYRSPEMIDIYRGFPIDEKCDIWALGVFLYKLCYYTTPFEREGNLAILHATFVFPHKPVYSDRLKGVISALLREDPRMRPNVYQVLKEICSMRGIEVPIKDIYSGGVVPTSSIPSITPLEIVQGPTSSYMPQSEPVNVPGVVRSIPSQPKLVVPEVTPMFRGRITVQQNNSMPSLDKFDFHDGTAINSTTGPASANFNDDPFALLDTSAKQRAKTQPVTPTVAPTSSPPDFNFDDVDITTRFPSVEDLAKELERAPFEFTKKTKTKVLPIPRDSHSDAHSRQPGNQLQTPSPLPIYDTRAKSPKVLPQPITTVSTSSSESSDGITMKQSDSTLTKDFTKPVPRPPPKQPIRPRPVSMYSQSNSDAYFEQNYRHNQLKDSNSSAESYTSDSYFNPTSAAAAVPSSSTTNNRNGSLIDSMPPEDREQLKMILTGLSQQSNTIILDTGGNHIDSNVDFLKVLDNEHTGSSSRPHHHRKSSQSHYLHASGTGEGGNGSISGSWMNRSSSVASKRSGSVSRHGKKSSMSSLKGMIGDAFKKFDNGAAATSYRSTSDSSMGPPPPRAVSAGSNPTHKRMASRISYSTESLSDSSDRKQDDDERRPSNSHKQSYRQKSSSNIKTNGSTIQNRVQQFLARSESPPPKKTASGYGKYTESSETSPSPTPDISSSNMPPPPPTKQNIAQKLEREVHREIKRASQELTRDWVETGQASSKAASSKSSLPLTDNGQRKDRNAPSSGKSISSKLLPSLSKKESSHGHSRQLSVISSESSDSSNSKRPPARPKKPAHLQSPRRSQTKVQTSIDDDWEARFNQKYPSLG